MTRKLVFFLLLTASIVSGGCDDERKFRDLSSVHGTVSGQVYKGLVTNVTVTAFALKKDYTPGDKLGSVTTDTAADKGGEDYEPGQFVIDVGSYQGDILLVAGGSQAEFKDEATGLLATFEKDTSLTAILPAFELGSHKSIFVSPFSTFAGHLAACKEHAGKPIAEGYEEAAKEVATLFKLGDFLNTKPLDFTTEKATTLDDETKFGLMLAALSQDSSRRWGAKLVHTTKYVTELAKDFDDCQPNGKDADGKPIVLGGAENNGEAGESFYSSRLPSAVSDFVASPQNQSGLDATDVKAWTDDMLGETQNTIKGWAYLGPIQQSSVTAFAMLADGTLGEKLGSTTSAANGSYQMSVAPYKGNMLIEVSGGTYVDERSGDIVTINPTLHRLHTVVPNVDYGDTTSNELVSGLSELAYKRLACSKGMVAERWETGAQWIADYFGISGFLNVEPVDFTVDTASATITPALKVGLWNAAISQLAADINAQSGLPADQFLTASSLIYKLGEDIEADCALDGTTNGSVLYVGTYAPTEETMRNELATAADTFLGSDRNLSGLDFSDLHTVLELFSGRVEGTIKGRAYKGLVKNFSIIAQDFHNWMNNGVVAQAVTGGADYQLDILNYFGPMLITVRGASAYYKDEALGYTVPMGAESEGYLQAMVPYFTNGDVMPLFNVSPLTDFAYTLGACYVTNGIFSQSQALAEADYQIASHFGLTDIYGTVPADMSVNHFSGAITDGDRMAMALSGLAQLTQEINAQSGIAQIDAIKLVRLLAEDLANDCMWNGQGPNGQISVGGYNFTSFTMRLEFARALYKWMNGVQNLSGIGATAANSIYAAIAANASTGLFPLNYPPIEYDLSGPTVTPETPTNTWIKGSSVQVVINATDQSPMASMAITSPAGIAALTDQDSSAARINFFLNTTSYSSGPLTMWVRAVDKFDNVTVQKYVLNIDNETPTVTNAAVRVNTLTRTLTGTFTAPSGITWITATPLAGGGAYSGWATATAGAYSIPVAVGLEGNNNFTVRVVNQVGTAAMYSQLVTRDTTGPVFTMAAQTHAGELGNQYYNDASLAVGSIVPAAVTWTTFVFNTEYKDAASFKYTGTLFTISAGDTFGSVSSQSKTLHKLVNGVWQEVAPFNGDLPYLGQDVFANNLNLSAAYTTAPTVWRIHMQGTDDLGNTSTKDYAFRVFVAPPPLTVSNYKNGLTCFGGITKAYLEYYDSNCTWGRNPLELLSKSNAGWTNNKVALFSVDLKNNSDTTVYFNPVSFASDYNTTAGVQNWYEYGELYFQDRTASSTVWNECNAQGNPTLDPRQLWDYSTGAWLARTSCQNYSSQINAETFSAGAAYSRAISLVVTSTGGTILNSDLGNEYAVGAGATVRVWILVAGPVGTTVMANNTACTRHDGSAGYPQLYTYYGQRKYLYWMWATGTSYDRYISCDTWYSMDFGWGPARAGNSYRYGARMPWETYVVSRDASGATLPTASYNLDMGVYY